MAPYAIPASLFKPPTPSLTAGEVALFLSRAVAKYDVLMTRWILRAYAKINLGLRVIGKRADGYHDLDTYFLQIDLADQLFFEKFQLGCQVYLQ